MSIEMQGFNLKALEKFSKNSEFFLSFWGKERFKILRQCQVVLITTLT
ncbi:hypothetical protein HID58_033677 [Brassica napus]|uniref:Uncharacterized protein n=1 Tax=Brassica napus TaxID=3708 RepID=A0ABQ8C1T8_BRANA|nr:hypothetical protein HID58_033677 [Brassica napus]